MIRHLQENEWEDEQKKELLLVDFYADWCGPCRTMGEILEQIPDIDILKVNVDLFPAIAKEYQVMSIPTMIILKNGELVAKHIGILEKEELISWFNEHK